MTEDRFLKRLRKRARKGLRGWPIATIAFYVLAPIARFAEQLLEVIWRRTREMSCSASPKA
jgi:hypothetical protein